MNRVAEILEARALLRSNERRVGKKVGYVTTAKSRVTRIDIAIDSLDHEVMAGCGAYRIGYVEHPGKH